MQCLLVVGYSKDLQLILWNQTKKMKHNNKNKENEEVNLQQQLFTDAVCIFQFSMFLAAIFTKSTVTNTWCCELEF